MKINKEKVLVFLAAIALSFLIYGNGIKGGFVFDDAAVIEKRGDLKDFGNFFNLFISPYHQNTPQTGLYRPLTMATYSLNYALFGQSPAGFHVVNIIIHALNCFLVFWLTLYLTRSRGLAYLSSLLFLVLPIHTEAVTSLVGRAELLAFFFGLLSIYFFVKEKKIFSALSFLLALFSKESAIMILPIMFYIDWVRTGASLWPSLKRIIFFAAPVATYSVFRAVALKSYFLADKVTTFVENPLKFSSFSERIATSFKVLIVYLEKIFWPIHLSADYSFNAIKIVPSILKSTEAIGGVLVLLLLVFLIVYPKTRKTLLGYGAVIFLFPYLIVSNLIKPIGTIMGERLTYLPSLGIVLILAFILAKLFESSKMGRIVAASIAVIVSIFWGAITFARNTDWRDNESLFLSALEVSPESLLTRTGLAAVYIRENKWDEAEKQLEAAEKIYPDNSHEQNLLGIIADHKGNLKLAEQRYLRSIELGDNAINTRINLANLYFKENRYEEASQNLLKVIEFNPVPEYVIRYAYAQITLRKPDDALITVKKYFGDKITGKELNALVGSAYFVKGDYQKALNYLSTAYKEGKTDKDLKTMIDISKQMLGIK